VSKSFESKSANYEKEMANLGFSFYKSLKKPNLSVGADLPRFNKTSLAITQPDGTIAFQSISQANSSISAFASQVVTATGGTLFINSDIQRFEDFSSDVKQYNGIPIRFGINQPLFGLNTWKYQDKIQPLLVEEAKKNYQTKIEEALGTATERYFNILIINQNLEIALTNEKVNENLLKITEERLLLGKVSRDEKLQLEIELNNAKLAVSQATSQLDQSIATLYTFLGRKSPETNQVFSIPQIKDIEKVNTSALLKSYKENRAELIAYKRSLQESDLDIAQAKADFGFQASLRASIGLARGSNNFSEVYSDPFEEQQFNLSISVPILDWGKKRSAVQQMKIKKQNIDASFKQQLLELEVNIEQEAIFFSRLQNEIALLKDIMEKAEERFSISNDRYILGNIDITNLTLAQRDKDQTKRNYVNALKAYWTSYYRLRALTGYDIINNKEITYN
jgi:outer membrane protein TolC